METTKKFLSDLRKAIANGNLSIALKQLRSLVENSSKLDEVILQSARFHNISKQIRQGTVSFDVANLTISQITDGLLALISEIEDQSKHPNINEELEKASTAYYQTADKIYNINKVDNANFS